MIKSGQDISKRFTITDPTGALVNGDSLPTAILVIGGVNDAAVMTVSNLSTGKYKIVGTMPSGIANGKSVELEISVTIGGILTADVLSLGTVDNKYVDDLEGLPVSDGVTVTQDTIGTDAQPIGQVPPYATIYAYIGTDLQYKFTEVADGDGDFAIKLPTGSTWRLVARRPSLYEDTEAEVTL